MYKYLSGQQYIVHLNKFPAHITMKVPHWIRAVRGINVQYVI